MLAEPDIRRLLAAAMAYDNRKPGDAQVLAWSEAARRGRWTFEAALDAIHEHYARRTDFLMPGHITEHLRADRRQPARLELDAGERRQLDAGPARTSETGGEPVRAFAQIPRAFSRWNTRRSRREPLTAERRAQVEAELAEARRRTDGEPA